MNEQDQNAYLPTEEEIAAACQEVQAIWGPREERKRRLWAIAGPVETPEVAAMGETAE